MNKFKDNLQRLVREGGITMAQLGRATNIAPQTLNNWASGQEPRSLEKVKRVADYFEISMDELCFNEIDHNATGKITDYHDEINAGVFEVVLRRIKK